MKKHLSIFTSLVFVVLTSNAQVNSVAKINNFRSFKSSINVVSENINDAVLNRFKKSFPGITDDSWEKIPNGYVVRFTSKGIQTWAFLTTKGNCEGRIRYYSEEELPIDIRKLVKSNYYDFSIISIKEVTYGRATAYFVTIEDKSIWKIIHVVDGEMTVLQEYLKGS